MYIIRLKLWTLIVHRSLNPSGIICFIAYDSAKKEMDNFVKDKEDRKPFGDPLSLGGMQGVDTYSLLSHQKTHRR